MCTGLRLGHVVVAMEACPPGLFQPTGETTLVKPIRKNGGNSWIVKKAIGDRAGTEFEVNETSMFPGYDYCTCRGCMLDLGLAGAIGRF